MLGVLALHHFFAQRPSACEGRESLFDFPGCSQKPDKSKLALNSLEHPAFPGGRCSAKEPGLIRSSELWLEQ